MKPVTWVGSAKRDLVTCASDVQYVATFPEAVYVLHVFEKKTRQASARDLALGQQRYRAMIKERRR